MYIIEGFVFEDEQTAELAKKEQEGIRFIKERTALDNSEAVLKLYTKLLDQKLFVTPVGIRFMIELQNILLRSPEIAKNKITPIEVSAMVVKQEKKVEDVEVIKKEYAVKLKKAEETYKKPYHTALFFAIIFAVSVVGMFVITKVSGNNVNIINYRNEILNEYSQWEQQLKDKEAELKAWEAELESR